MNVIVYDFEGVLTPDDNFTGRSTASYGVGETVQLSCTITPSGLTGSQVGGLTWIQWIGGVGSLSNVTNVGTADYDAGAYSGTAKLRLMVGPCGTSTGAMKAYDRYVVAPDGGYCVRKSGTDIYHIQGRMSVGVLTDFYITPDNVSFGNVDFKEGSCSYYGTGMLAGLADHSAWSIWYDIIGNGENKVDLPYNKDAAQMASMSITDVSQYSAGTGYWDIPWKYKVDAVEGTLTTVRQEFRTYSNGDHGVKKDGEGWYDVNHNDSTHTTGWQ